MRFTSGTTPQSCPVYCIHVQVLQDFDNDVCQSKEQLSLTHPQKRRAWTWAPFEYWPENRSGISGKSSLHRIPYILEPHCGTVKVWVVIKKDSVNWPNESDLLWRYSAVLIMFGGTFLDRAERIAGTNIHLHTVTLILALFLYFSKSHVLITRPL